MFDPRPLYCSSLTTSVVGTYVYINFVDFSSAYCGMNQFPSSFSNLYILLIVDYVSKWVEAIPTRTNDANVVVKFLRSHIFTWFSTPGALIMDGGTHFCNKLVDKILQKYGVQNQTSQMDKLRCQIGR